MIKSKNKPRNIHTLNYVHRHTQRDIRYDKNDQLRTIISVGELVLDPLEAIP